MLLVSAEADYGRWASDCGAVAFLPKVRLASADLRSLLRRAADEDLTPPRGRLTAAKVRVAVAWPMTYAQGRGRSQEARSAEHGPSRERAPSVAGFD